MDLTDEEIKLIQEKRRAEAAKAELEKPQRQGYLREDIYVVDRTQWMYLQLLTKNEANELLSSSLKLAATKGTKFISLKDSKYVNEEYWNSSNDNLNVCGMSEEWAQKYLMNISKYEGEK